MIRLRSLLLALVLLLPGCQTSPSFDKTVKNLRLHDYLGKWYVIASRPTMFESDAYNASETYTWDNETKKIDVAFRYNKGAFDGPEKSIPQTARVPDETRAAHWKISIWWLPFELDYLVLDIAPDYQWTVVGVPNQKYLWVMSRSPYMEEQLLAIIIQKIGESGYRIDGVQRVPQKLVPTEGEKH